MSSIVAIFSNVTMARLNNIVKNYSALPERLIKMISSVGCVPKKNFTLLTSLSTYPTVTQKLTKNQTTLGLGHHLAVKPNITTFTITRCELLINNIMNRVASVNLNFHSNFVSTTIQRTKSGMGMAAIVSVAEIQSPPDPTYERTMRTYCYDKTA